MLWEDDITLVPDGGVFSLNVPGQPPIRLTDNQVLKLSQMGAGFRAQVLLKQLAKSDSVETIVSIPVRDALAWIGAMRDSVQLSLQTSLGEDMTFSLSPNLAQKLAQEIPEQLEKIQVGDGTLQ